MHAEVVESVAFWIGIGILLGALPAHDCEIDVPVREVDLARQVAVPSADFPQTQALLEELGGDEGIFRGNCDMPNPRHAVLLFS